MTQELSLASSWKDWMAYFRWLYLPTTRMTARDVYELVATNSFSADGLYLNLGYWKTAQNIDTACWPTP